MSVEIRFHVTREQAEEIRQHAAFRWSGSMADFVREAIRREIVRHPLPGRRAVLPGAKAGNSEAML